MFSLEDLQRLFGPAAVPAAAGQDDRAGPLNVQPGQPALQADQADAVQALPPARPTDGSVPQRAPFSGIPERPATAEPAKADGPGMLDRFAGNGGWDMLMGLGAGLAGGKGWGDGLSKGLDGASRAAALSATSGLAQQKFAIEKRKADQALAGQNLTLKWLTTKGVSEADATAALAAAQGGRPELLQSYLTDFGPSKAPEGFRKVEGGAFEPIPGGPADPNTKKATAQATAEGTTAGTPDTPQKMDVPQGDGTTRPTWVAPGQPNGMPIGAATPQAAVDQAKLAEERAKEQAKLEAGALKKGEVAQAMSPVLQRAHDAYEKLVKADAIGPTVGSAPMRQMQAFVHADSEKLRQEYETAAKDLELFQAQAKMKGQGAITESERRLLALTLPRLDGLDGQTGLTTLRAMRDTIGRDIGNAQGSPIASPAMAAGGAQPASGPASPAQRPAAVGAPAGAVDHLRQNPALRDAFDAKYGAGAAARVLGN